MADEDKKERLNEEFDSTRPYVEFLKMKELVTTWYEGLGVLRMEELVPCKEVAKWTAIFVVDMINDFCKPDGALYSARIEGIISPIASLLRNAQSRGVGINLVQDCHDENAREFRAFPKHAVKGTRGAETITELMELPFSDTFRIFLKNSLSAADSCYRYYGQGDLHTLIFSYFINQFYYFGGTAIIVGDCTNLCVREIAMGLQLWANEWGKDVRVVIPANCVQTFDLPFEKAKELGAMPHPGDFYHLLSLYEMRRNGIEIVGEII
ncbi:MAG: cysteine hydrolase [Candidatus Spechtbacteria bacterium]|nr:cysteine hydrolase [Candidatus Spechtbacteria bacterium]